MVIHYKFYKTKIMRSILGVVNLASFFRSHERLLVNEIWLANTKKALREKDNGFWFSSVIQILIASILFSRIPNELYM